MKIFYICKYADVSDDEKPACGSGLCSDVCKYTSDPYKAKYKEHRFEYRGNDGNLWEVDQGDPGA